MATDIGIDLGTASILVYVKGKGVVLKEPSVVAFDVDTRKIKAIGEEARLMIGRTPGNIVAVRPLRQGVISDYSVTEKMLKYFVHKSVGKSLFGRKPRISVCVPSGVTVLPVVSGRTYHECDIDTLNAKSRGAKRIIYSDDGQIYYTDNHYKSFTLLYGDDVQ